MAFLGNQPPERYTSVTKDTFSGDGSTVAFTLSRIATTNGVEVFVENVQQEPTTAYSISGTTLTFTAAPVTGSSNIYVLHRNPTAATVTVPDGTAINCSEFTSNGIDDNATSTAMTIDSSGNVLVGTTVTNPGGYTSGSGAEITGIGIIRAARAGDTLVLNRLGSNGTIATFRKDGTTLGVIGVTGDEIIFGSTDGSGCGLRFDGDNRQIKPDNGSGTLIDNAIDIGNTSNRFKNLYLSGGVYLGGTGSANYLDDYEEGTWTPAVSATSTNPTVTYTTQSGSYTKIGRTVTLHFRIDYSARSGGTGTFLLTGFPFQTSSAQYYAASGNMMTYGIDYGTGIANLAFEVSSNNSRAYIIETKESNGVWANTSIEDFNTGNTYLRGTITYVTDS